MELAVYNIKGEDTGRKVTLNDEIFAIAEPNEHAVYLDVKQFLANKRQGTHKAKERSEIAGSTKKLGRQKGGGGARHGDIKSPLFHGGGRVFHYYISIITIEPLLPGTEPFTMRRLFSGNTLITCRF